MNWYKKAQTNPYAINVMLAINTAVDEFTLPQTLGLQAGYPSPEEAVMINEALEIVVSQMQAQGSPMQAQQEQTIEAIKALVGSSPPPEQQEEAYDGVDPNADMSIEPENPIQ